MPEVQTSNQALAVITAMVDKRQQRFLDLLGEDEAKRFRIMMLQMCERTPALLQCTPVSLVGVALEAAELKLPMAQSLGYAWAVPFFDRKLGRKRAVFVPGYKGLMELARRSAQVEHIWADVIRKDDDLLIVEGSERRLEHSKPDLSEQTDEYLDDDQIVGAYCCARLVSGLTVFKVMPRAEIEKIRRSSPSGNSGPWSTNYAAMCMKTPIRALCNKELPLSPEDQRVVARDEYFDAGVEPPLTDAEYEEVRATAAETTAIRPEVLEDESSAIPGPISPRTLKQIETMVAFRKLDPNEVSQLCDRIAGVEQIVDLSEADAQELLASLQRDDIEEIPEGDAAGSLFPLPEDEAPVHE